jgi:small-conductance mechanosensitive channel
VAFAAWIGWRAVNIAIAAKLEAEGDMPPSGVPDDEDATAIRGRTRLGTILPLVRVVLLAVIVTVAAMIALSSLGVDVAPLFAGAGVVGLAVGFGAQALIRDIFSGFFFLIDDAFRVGEYVEMGDMKGTVEKISLRSFQLRHHNGPLHTVPFGEIKQLTNHSRDWVIMKLPLRLTFDTDVERVRKLLKKLGQSLLSHPEIGGNFLQPLKSQGVVEIDDSALVLRVKFMTRPDEQWVTRKVVYAAIQELFRKEGIRFANREVTVRISGDSAADPETRAKAAAAGAQSALAASQGASKPPLDD